MYVRFTHLISMNCKSTLISECLYILKENTNIVTVKY